VLSAVDRSQALQNTITPRGAKSRKNSKLLSLRVLKEFLKTVVGMGGRLFLPLPLILKIARNDPLRPS